jgi:hypothetical protein
MILSPEPSFAGVIDPIVWVQAETTGSAVHQPRRRFAVAVTPGLSGPANRHVLNLSASITRDTLNMMPDVVRMSIVRIVYAPVIAALPALVTVAMSSAASAEVSSGQTTSPKANNAFAVETLSDKLIIGHSGSPVAAFVYRDDTILRPYFSNVYSPDGLKLTRNHPPIPGSDATDHDTMHPGIWLAFGDINGHDFWRNQGRIEHRQFSQPPTVQEDGLYFATDARLLTRDGQVICLLSNRLMLCADTAGWLLFWDATFRADEHELTFGDQEEMGFGARVATPLTELSGGTIVNSNRERLAASTWGQPAKWCDYSGNSGSQRGGITLIPAPGNFRESWWHNRDYGLFVANAFGRAAMKQGAPSAVTVKRGESLRLRFAAVLHDNHGYDPVATYERVVKRFDDQDD